MSRVFINENGKFYKADEPTSPNHAESTFPTPDMLTVLTDEPCTREEMIRKINEDVVTKFNAVLASE